MRTTSSDGTSAVAGTPLDAAIVSPERTIRGRLEVDWDKSGFSGSQYFGQVPSFDDLFLGASLDPRWSLAGAGAAFDSVNHQAVLPNILGTNTGSGSPQVTTGGTTLTLTQNFDMHGANLLFKFTLPTLTSTTRRMDIYIVDRDTGDYWYARQDSGGLYVQTYNFSTVAPLSKVATWQNANTSFVSKQIDLSFTGDCNPTAIFTPVSGGTYTALPFNTSQFPVPPPRLNNCKIIITSYSTAVEAAASTTIQEVRYFGAPNTDNVTASADSLEIDRSLQGTLPAQAQIIEGSSVAQINASLTSGETLDERLDAAWKYSPFNTGSPLYSSPVLGVAVRASVDVETPSGVKTFQKAIGSLQSFDVDVDSGEAPLVAYDYRNKLAGNVQIPPIDGGIFGLNATAIIDYALASGGVNIGPPIQPTATLWAPMHGSAYPMVSGRTSPTFGRYFINGESQPLPALGYTTNVDSSYRPLFINGPFYNATTNPSSKALLAGGGSTLQSSYGLPSTTSMLQFKCYFSPDVNRGNMFSQTNAKGVINLWIKGDAFTGTLDSSGKMMTVWFQAAYNRNQQDMGIGIYIGSSRELGISYWTSSHVLAGVAPFATLPSDGAWHNIGVSWDASGSTLNVAGSMDGATSGVTAVPSWDMTLLPSVDTWIPNCWYHTYLPIAEVQAYGVSNIDTKCGYTNANSFIQNTRVDYSLLELTGNVDTTQREAWDLITEIGATEAAATYFDEDGVFQYRTRSRSADTTHQTVQKTVTAKESLKSLKISQALDTVRNTITANVVPLNPSRNVVVFSTSDTFVLPASKKTQLTFELTNPTTNLWMVQASGGAGPYTPIYWDNAYPWPDPNQAGYGVPHGMACARSAQTGGSVRGMPFPSIVYMDSKTITLEFINPYSTVTYITNDGQNGNGGFSYTMFGGGTTYDKVMQFWGNPSLLLVGDMITTGAAQPVTYVETYSVGQYGTQTLTLNDSQWHQDISVALGLAGQVAADLALPFPVASITAIGDPRLQLDDRVKLQAGDYDGTKANPIANLDFWVQGITDHITPDGGYEQSLVLRGATSVLKWASTLADTDKGYLTINPTNKWDRFTWG